MTGWLILLAIVALIAVAFWRWSGLGRDFAAPFAAVVTFALAGYAWNGSPGLAGQPGMATKPDNSVTEALIETRVQFQQAQFDAAGNWIMISDGLMRSGKVDQAVGALRAGVEKYPRNADLWTAMGAALLRQSNGRMTMPALYAFNEARRVAPIHPGPDFFAGIAKIEEGDLTSARAIWAALLARAPEKADWKAGLASRITLLDQAIMKQAATQKRDSQ